MTLRPSPFDTVESSRETARGLCAHSPAKCRGNNRPVNGCDRTLLAGVKSISGGCPKMAEPSYSTSTTYGSPCDVSKRNLLVTEWRRLNKRQRRGGVETNASNAV